MLNEDVLSASCSHTALRVVTSDDGSRAVPRYSEAAGIEHHPQITDFVPRRYRSIALLIGIAVLTTAGLAALDYFSRAAQPFSSIAGAATLQLAEPGSVAAWVATVVLLLASAACLLVYFIRRHRIDDFRGRYRIWLACATACLLASVNSATGLHHVLAAAMGHVTGWTALRDGAVWWLAGAGVPLAWVFVRALLDMKECRLAAALFVLATIGYAAGTAIYLETLDLVDSSIAPIVVGAIALLGHWLALAAVVSYARFVILDAQGLVATRPRITGRRKTKSPSADQNAAGRNTTVVATTSSSRTVAPSKPTVPRPAKSPAAGSQWVDGSRPERDDYDGDDDSPGDNRKLTKSERKQLRKLKMQNRAA